MKDDAKTKLIELSLLNLNRYDRQIRKLISNVETFHLQSNLTILRIGYFGTADFFLKSNVEKHQNEIFLNPLLMRS